MLQRPPACPALAAASCTRRLQLRIMTGHIGGFGAAQAQQQSQHRRWASVVVCSVPSSGAFVTGWSPKTSGDIASQPADFATPTVQPQRLLHHDRGEHLPGDLLGGKYTVQDVLGRGSTGITYKVRRMLEPSSTWTRLLRAKSRFRMAMPAVPLVCLQ